MAQAVFFRKIKSDRKGATSATQLALRIRKEGKKRERREEKKDAGRGRSREERKQKREDKGTKGTHWS